LCQRQVRVCLNKFQHIISRGICSERDYYTSYLREKRLGIVINDG
jgi:hypothetical protein